MWDKKARYEKDILISKLILFIISVFSSYDFGFHLSMYYLGNSSQSFRTPSPFCAQSCPLALPCWLVGFTATDTAAQPAVTSTLGFGHCLTCHRHGRMQPVWEHAIKNRSVASQVWFNCREEEHLNKSWLYWHWWGKPYFVELSV